MFAATTLALLFAAAQADTHDLKWKLKEGDVFYNKTAVSMDQTLRSHGHDIEQKIEMKTVLEVQGEIGQTRHHRRRDDLPGEQDRCARDCPARTSATSSRT